MKSVDFLRDTESIRKETQSKILNCFGQAKIHYPNANNQALKLMCSKHEMFAQLKLKCLEYENGVEKFTCLNDSEKRWEGLLKEYQNIICDSDIFAL